MKNKIIASLLFLFGVILTLLYIYQREKNFTVLTYTQADYKIISTKNDKKSKAIRSTFTAKENYLGEISIGLNIADRLSSNKMTFSLKEITAHKPYHTYSYNVASTNFKPLFPIGFPVISESKGKVYEFTVDITNSTVIDDSNRSIALTDLKTKYQYPKKVLFDNKNLIIPFLVKKLHNIAINNNLIALSFYYFLPFIYFILKKTVKNIFVIPLTLLLVSLFDIFYVNVIYDSIFMLLLSIWLYFCVSHRYDERIMYLVTGIFLGVLAITRIFGTAIQVEKASSWVYLFFLGATLLLIYNKVRSIKPRVTLEEVLNILLKSFFGKQL